MNQKIHHSKINFLDEYKNLLEENGIEYDENYLWNLYSAPTGLAEILLHESQGVALAKVFRPYGAIGKSQALKTDYLFYNASRLSDDPTNHLQTTQTPDVRGSSPGLQHPTSKFNLHKLRVSEAISKKCVKQE